MTSSKLKAWTSKLSFAVALVVLLAGSAFAGGRKRIVVLDFEGPKADKFHDDVVRLIKRNHTVVSSEKWNGIAEELDATKLSEKDVKKVARKLKVDGVISGKVEKRRGQYIVQLKLRAGKTGEFVGSRVDTKSESAGIEGQAARDLKDELLPIISDLEANHGGGSDDEDDSPPKRSDDDEEDGSSSRHSGFVKHDDDERGGDRVSDDDGNDDEHMSPRKKREEERKRKEEEARKKKEEDEERLAQKKKDDEERARKKKDDDEEASSEGGSEEGSAASSDDDDSHERKRPNKRTASSDDDNGSAEAEADTETDTSNAANFSPGERAIDAVVGMSFTARRLTFKYASDLATPPAGYKQSVPVAGALIDATIYPLAFTHKRKDLLRGIGISFMYDRVLRINSQKKYLDMGMPAIASIKTSEQKFGIGAVFRYPIGKLVVGGKFGYMAQSFTLGQTLPNGASVDIPSVTYAMFEIGGLVRYPVTPKITADLDASVLAVTGAGDIQSADQYGRSTVFGQQFQLGADYAILKNVFVRAAFRFERIGHSFKGTGKQTTMRDSDPDVDVSGATDMYYGAIATIGYLY